MWHYSAGKDRFRTATRPADNASTGQISTESHDPGPALGPATRRPALVPKGLARAVLWGCAVFIAASVFSLQCALADMPPPDMTKRPGSTYGPDKPKPHRPTTYKPKPDDTTSDKPKPPGNTLPKNDPQSRNSPGLFSGFSTKMALLGTGCIVGSVEFLAFAGLIASRRRRKDEMASRDSQPRSTDSEKSMGGS